MHICFVSREYPPNPMGGIGTYVANMTRILAESGATVSVLTQDHPKAPTHGFDTPHITCDGRLRVHYLPFCDADWGIHPNVRTPVTDALERVDVIAAFGVVVADALGALQRVEKLDAIEAPEYEAPLLHYQMLRAALPISHPWQSVPTVVHLHSPSHMIFEHDDDPLTGEWVRARKAREAASIEMADGLIAPSTFLARQVSHWLNYKEGRVRVIPYPIGPLLECPKGAAEPGLCLFVGRVEPRKGVFEFVEAAVSVAETHPEAHFRFVGGPHHRDGKSDGMETAALIRDRIPERLRAQFDFAGRVPRETLGAEYTQASFVAVPSRWDNFPNTCMEAMSCGRPVLASDQGGMAEMIENNAQGVVVKGETRRALVENLRAGLETLFAKSPDELAQMGMNARKRMLSFCDDAAVTKIHRDYYAKLADGHAFAVRMRAEEELPETGVVLLDDGADADRILRATGAVDGQTVEVARKVIFGTAHEHNVRLRAGLSTWTVPRKGGSELGARLAELEDLPPVLYIGAADDVLAPDAMRQAANCFANLPECGFCSCWTACRGTVYANLRNEPLHLIRPTKTPERWFFRTEAILKSGGMIGTGYYLNDILRDLVLRLMKNGWRGGSISGPLVEISPREPEVLIRTFAFCERRDSVREVALAHAELFMTDAQSVAESLVK